MTEVASILRHKMKKNEIITIVYEIRCTKQYLCASGFFSFCGFPVTGIHAEKLDTIPVGDEYVTILLSRAEVQDKDDSVIYLTVGDENAPNCNIATEIIEELVNRNLMDRKDEKVLTAIRSIYSTHKLWLHEYNIQYYFCLKDETPEIIKTFLDVSSSLHDVASQNPENPYVWHAFFHSMRRIQTLSSYNNRTSILDYELINNDLDEYIKKYPEFLGFYVLKGFLYAATNKKDEAIKTFSELIDNKLSACGYLDSYTSELLYMIGRLNEYSFANDRDARLFYTLSYLKNNDNYRALYKLARFNQNRGRETEAWELYSRIEHQFNNIAEQKYLQPRESEYLFKVIFCKWKISNGNKYASEHSVLMDKLSKIPEEEISSQKFYDDFYQELSGKYKTLIMDRLRLQLKKWIKKEML